MYVCICHEVTNDDIILAVESGVRTFQGLARQLHVAQKCGVCAKTAKEIFFTALSSTLQAEQAQGHCNTVLAPQQHT